MRLTRMSTGRSPRRYRDQLTPERLGLTRIIASVDQTPVGRVSLRRSAQVSRSGQLRSAQVSRSGQRRLRSEGQLSSGRSGQHGSANPSRLGDPMTWSVRSPVRPGRPPLTVRLLAVVEILWVFSKVTLTTPFRPLRPVTHVNYRPLIRLIPSSPSQRSAISERVG